MGGINSSGINSSNVAQAILKLVAADALPAVLGGLVVGNLVERDYEPVIMAPNDVVNVPTPAGSAQIALNLYSRASFQVPDVTRVLAVPSLLELHMRPAVDRIARHIESALMALRPGPPIGTPGCPMSETTVDEAERILFETGTPTREQRYLVCDSATYAQARRLAGFREYEAEGDAGLRALVDGPVAKIRDLFVFQSRYARRTGDNGVTTTHNLAFSHRSIVLAMRRLPGLLPGPGAISEYAELGNFGMRVVMGVNPHSLTQEFTLDVLCGCGVVGSGAVEVLT